MRPFKPTPYDYQVSGAVGAAWHGRTLIADEQGLGKTLQALLAARLLDPARVLIICPPILATNWAREAETAGNTDAATVITPKDKTPNELPARGYVVTSDALVVARRPLRRLLEGWGADLMIIDEAHRLKNYRAQRTKAISAIARKADKTICLTGTPFISSPLDVLPLLRILKKTHHFPPNFVDRYTREDFWGKRQPRVENLDELHVLLSEHVWTRRTKAEVLPELPAKRRSPIHVRVDDKALAEAMADLHAEIDALQVGEVDEWAASAISKVAQLRRATGLAKVGIAVEWVAAHLAGTQDRPLICWAIHRDVIAGLADGLAAAVKGVRVEVIDGSTPRGERDRIVAAFQAGQVDVLVAQMVAAGVGLTLTASSDVLFIETDWTPAVVVQAEDRAHRIGTRRSVQVSTLVAEGTLDGHIHATLAANVATLDRLTPGSDHHVAVRASSVGVKQLLKQLASRRLASRKEEPLRGMYV